MLSLVLFVELKIKYLMLPLLSQHGKARFLLFSAQPTFSGTGLHFQLRLRDPPPHIFTGFE